MCNVHLKWKPHLVFLYLLPTASIRTWPPSQLSILKIHFEERPETHLTTPGIPTFKTYTEHRQHILVHTAATFRDFARKGFTEGMSGHISVRDPEFANYIWMNPLGRHFGLMTAGDLICLDVQTGNIVGGNRVFTPLARPHNFFLIRVENFD